MARKPEMGKYLLWSFFRKSATVRRYLPDTRRFSLEAFRELLTRYGMVYVKPVAGSRGRGIIKVWKHDGAIHVQHTVRAVKSLQSVKAAHQYMNQLREGKAYLVQQGIQLATINGKPFDIRVMMQREKPGGKWLYSGMLAKIAGGRSVVTNVALSHGTVMEVPDALRKALGWKNQRIEKCISDLREISFSAARHFDSYQLYRELGFDMAVDKKGRIWMIEQNTGPSHPLFKHLKSNLTMYRTIQARWGRYQTALKGNGTHKQRRK